MSEFMGISIFETPEYILRKFVFHLLGFTDKCNEINISIEGTAFYKTLCSRFDSKSIRCIKDNVKGSISIYDSIDLSQFMYIEYDKKTKEIYLTTDKSMPDDLLKDLNKFWYSDSKEFTTALGDLLGENIKDRLNKLYQLNDAWVKANDELHEFINTEATLGLKKFTKECGLCGSLDYKVKSTTIADTLLYKAEVFCGNCGVYFNIVPLLDLLKYAHEIKEK